MSETHPDFVSYIQNCRRILIHDGAVGTVLKKRNFGEHEFRGKPFAEHDCPLQGRYELLCLTQPEAVSMVHEKYLAAGADIVSTNTFCASPLELVDCGLEDKAAEIYRTAAWLARSAANKYSEITPDRPRYVAGVIGPTRFITGEIPAAGDFSTAEFDDLVDSYRITAEALIKGGVDCLLVESIYILQNARAALTAIESMKRDLGKHVPVWASFTLANDARTLYSGESIVEAAQSLEPFHPEIVGLNCGADPAHLSEYLTAAFEIGAGTAAFHPSAGLPDTEGQYPWSIESFIWLMERVAERGWVDIVGGCCGTDPTYIAAIDRAMEAMQPRRERLRSTKV